MNLLIDNRGGTPIYEQIYAQIKGQILSGALEQDEALPSIRALAKDLRISVITTKRAYDELLREGFIYAVAGKGCYVARKNAQLLREEHLRELEEHLSKVAQLVAVCNLTKEEVWEMYDLLAGEGEG